MGKMVSKVDVRNVLRKEEREERTLVDVVWYFLGTFRAELAHQERQNGDYFGGGKYRYY